MANTQIDMAVSYCNSHTEHHVATQRSGSGRAVSSSVSREDDAARRRGTAIMRPSSWRLAQHLITTLIREGWQRDPHVAGQAWRPSAASGEFSHQCLQYPDGASSRRQAGGGCTRHVSVFAVHNAGERFDQLLLIHIGQAGPPMAVLPSSQFRVPGAHAPPPSNAPSL